MRINRITSSRFVFIVAPIYARQPHAVASLKVVDRIARPLASVHSRCITHARTYALDTSRRKILSASGRAERATRENCRCGTTTRQSKSPRDRSRRPRDSRSSPSQIARFLSGFSGDARLRRSRAGSLYSAGSGTHRSRCVRLQACRFDD